MITLSMQSSIKEICLRSMKKYQCFLCQVLSDDEFALLAHIQYEIGLPGSLTTEEIIRDGGFCTYHFHELLRISNTTYLSRFLAKLANDFVQNRIKLLGLWKADCQLCSSISKKEADYITAFYHLYASDSDFQQKYWKDGSLCFPHLEKILKTDLAQIGKRKLIHHQMNVLKDLQEKLSNFSQKSYSQAEKDEVEAPEQIIKIVVGRFGTFK